MKKGSKMDFKGILYRKGINAFKSNFYTLKSII